MSEGQKWLQRAGIFSVAILSVSTSGVATSCTPSGTVAAAPFARTARPALNVAPQEAGVQSVTLPGGLLSGAKSATSDRFLFGWAGPAFARGTPFDSMPCSLQQVGRCEGGIGQIKDMA